MGEQIYRLATRSAMLALPLAAPFSGKLRRGVEGRRATLPSMRAWAAAHRDVGRPLIWLHAPSVGEALMAQAIIAALRARDPSLQFAFTFFSPSAERVADRIGADWIGYVPWDTAADMSAALDLLRPACVAFVRTELWPVLVREAHRRGSRVVMLNAVLARGSSRLGTGARMLLGSAYASLDAVGAAGDVDAAHLPLLGVPPERIAITGDARFDQVWERVRRLDQDRPLLRPFRSASGHWLVAGSTWPADEERLLPALRQARRQHGGLERGWRAVIAPHEPTPAHLAGLERGLDRAGLSHVRLHTDEEPRRIDADVVVVDRVGVLADLYAIADAAYVGGGFGSAGLHSVVEPAALGVPVIYGPRHGNAHEAQRLANAGGGFIVEDSMALAELLGRIGTDRSVHAGAAASARRFVEDHVGGADRSAALVLDRLRAAQR